jgi:hypothetical protein
MAGSRKGLQFDYLHNVRVATHFVRNVHGADVRTVFLGSSYCLCLEALLGPAERERGTVGA